jgi:hypothetical protein
LVVVFVVVFAWVEVVAVVPVAAVPVVPLVEDIAPLPVVSVDIALVSVDIVLVVPEVSVDIVPVVPVIEVSVDIVVLLVEELSVATAAVSVTLLLFTSLLQAKPKTVSARMVMRIRVFFICLSSQMVVCESVAAT